MRPPERGATPAGFRNQVLARLRNQAAQQGTNAQRLQQRVAFERLLARLAPSGAWILKGGFALELRYGWEYRPTRDVDLRIDHPIEEALERLRAALTEVDAGDHFTFELGAAVEELQGAPGGSVRVRVTARLAGIVFNEFHIDLSAGDPMLGEPEILVGSGLLDFAGIPRVRFPVYPIAQQLAEKLHAATQPRKHARQDFVDLIVTTSREKVTADELCRALQATFEARGTHELPVALPPPPETWAEAFGNLASQLADAPTTKLEAGHQIASRFWNPVLSGEATALVWNPRSASWETSSVF